MNSITAVTLILFIDDGHLGPVEEEHDVYESLVDHVDGRVDVDGEGFVLVVHVDTSFQVRDFQRVADGLNVRPQMRIRRTENRLRSVLHLKTRFITNQSTRLIN